MELSPYVESLRESLVAAAEAGGETAQQSAALLSVALAPAVRLALLDALSDAAAEITGALDEAGAGVRVEVHLRGREPGLVVTVDHPAAEAEAGRPAGDETTDSGGTARITLRLAEAVKARVEEAAGRQNVSVNTWLVGAVTRGLQPPSDRRAGRRLTGYARG